MRFTSLIVATLAASSFAAPTSTAVDGVYNFSYKLAEYYARVSKHARSANLSTICNTTNITLPSFASSHLPPPSDQKLRYVAVGRGTQNYTCNTSAPDSAPVAIGALASLYNATCIAAKYPDLINTLPSTVYKNPLPKSASAALPPANIRLLGHHYFRNTHTPVFNLDTTLSQQYGIAVTKSVNSTEAPPDAVKGENGAVPWLYLTAQNTSTGDYKSVYRVQTAGGQPPKTCDRMPAVFTVQYAANYYFYGK